MVVFEETRIKSRAPKIVEKYDKMVQPNRLIQRHYSDSSLAPSAYDSDTTVNQSCNTTPLPLRRSRRKSSCDVLADESSISSGSSLNSLARAAGSGNFFTFLQKFKKRSEHNRLQIPVDARHVGSNTSINTVVSTTSSFAYFKPSTARGRNKSRTVKSVHQASGYDDRLNPFMESDARSSEAPSTSKAVSPVVKPLSNPFDDDPEAPVSSLSRRSNFSARLYLPKTTNASQIKSEGKRQLETSKNGMLPSSTDNSRVSGNSSDLTMRDASLSSDVDNLAKTPAHLISNRHAGFSLPNRKKKRPAPPPPSSRPRLHTRAASLGSSNAGKPVSHVPGKRKAPPPPLPVHEGSGSASNAEFQTPPPSPVMKSAQRAKTKQSSPSRHLYRNVLLLQEANVAHTPNERTSGVNGTSGSAVTQASKSTRVLHNNVDDRGFPYSGPLVLPPNQQLNNLNTLKGGRKTPPSFNILLTDGTLLRVRDGRVETASSPQDLVSDPGSLGANQTTVPDLFPILQAGTIISDGAEAGVSETEVVDVIPHVMRTSNELLALSDGRLVPKSDRVKALVESFSTQETKFQGKQWYKRPIKKTASLQRSKKKEKVEEDMPEVSYFRSSIANAKSSSREFLTDSSDADRPKPRMSPRSPTRRFLFRRETFDAEEGKRISLCNISELDREAEAIVKKKRSMDNARRYGFKYDEPYVDSVLEEESVRPLRYLTLDDLLPSTSDRNELRTHTSEQSANVDRLLQNKQTKSIVGNHANVKYIDQAKQKTEESLQTFKRPQESLTMQSAEPEKESRSDLDASILEFAKKAIAAENLLAKPSMSLHSAGSSQSVDIQIAKSQFPKGVSAEKNIMLAFTPQLEGFKINGIGNCPTSVTLNSSCRETGKSVVTGSSASAKQCTVSTKVIDHGPAEILPATRFEPMKFAESMEPSQVTNQTMPVTYRSASPKPKSSTDQKKTPETDHSSPSVEKTRREIAAWREKYFSTSVFSKDKENRKDLPKQTPGVGKKFDDERSDAPTKLENPKKNQPIMIFRPTKKVEDKGASQSSKTGCEAAVLPSVLTDNKKSQLKRLSDVTIDNLVGMITKAFQMNDLDKPTDGHTESRSLRKTNSRSVRAPLADEEVDNFVPEKQNDFRTVTLDIQDLSEPQPSTSSAATYSLSEIELIRPPTPHQLLSVRSLDRSTSFKGVGSEATAEYPVSPLPRSLSAPKVYENLARPVPLPRQCHLPKAAKGSSGCETGVEDNKLSGLDQGTRDHTSQRGSGGHIRRPSPAPRKRLEQEPCFLDLSKPSGGVDVNKKTKLSPPAVAERKLSTFSNVVLNPSSVTRAQVDRFEVVREDENGTKTEVFQRDGGSSCKALPEKTADASYLVPSKKTENFLKNPENGATAVKELTENLEVFQSGDGGSSSKVLPQQFAAGNYLIPTKKSGLSNSSENGVTVLKDPIGNAGTVEHGNIELHKTAGSTKMDSHVGSAEGRKKAVHRTTAEPSRNSDDDSMEVSDNIARKSGTGQNDLSAIRQPENTLSSSGLSTENLSDKEGLDLNQHSAPPFNSLNLPPLSSPKLVSKAASMSPTSEISMNQLAKSFQSESRGSPRNGRAKRNANRIRLSFFVEDATSRRGPYLVSLTEETKVLDLKKKVEKELAIAVANQKWFLGQEVADDESRAVSSYTGVQENRSASFLYVVRGNVASPTRQNAEAETTATVDRHVARVLQNTTTTAKPSVTPNIGENPSFEHGLAMSNQISVKVSEIPKPVHPQHPINRNLTTILLPALDSFCGFENSAKLEPERPINKISEEVVPVRRQPAVAMADVESRETGSLQANTTDVVKTEDRSDSTKLPMGCEGQRSRDQYPCGRERKKSSEGGIRSSKSGDGSDLLSQPSISEIYGLQRSSFEIKSHTNEDGGRTCTKSVRKPGAASSSPQTGSKSGSSSLDATESSDTKDIPAYSSFETASPSDASVLPSVEQCKSPKSKVAGTDSSSKLPLRRFDLERLVAEVSVCSEKGKNEAVLSSNDVSDSASRHPHFSVEPASGNAGAKDTNLGNVRVFSEQLKGRGSTSDEVGGGLLPEQSRIIAPDQPQRKNLPTQPFSTEVNSELPVAVPEGKVQCQSDSTFSYKPRATGPLRLLKNRSPLEPHQQVASNGLLPGGIRTALAGMKNNYPLPLKPHQNATPLPYPGSLFSRMNLDELNPKMVGRAVTSKGASVPSVSAEQSDYPSSRTKMSDPKRSALSHVSSNLSSNLNQVIPAPIATSPPPHTSNEARITNTTSSEESPVTPVPTASESRPNAQLNSIKPVSTVNSQMSVVGVKQLSPSYVDGTVISRDLFTDSHLSVLTTESPPGPSKEGGLRPLSPLLRSHSPSCKKDALYEFMTLDRKGAVPNAGNFECPICFSEVEDKEGVVLRDCLHMFCRECLVHAVQFTVEPQVPCPYRDDQFACHSYLQDREVRGLLSKEDYEAYLSRSLELAAAAASDSIRCCKENCPGWCICDTKDVATFTCPVCRSTNCIQCKAIHTGKTCEEYQRSQIIDESSAKTEAYLQEMMTKGEGMPCPQCSAFLIKQKWGCDWIRCAACRTEICWVTRGPRWGPGGKGDTSGGCRCGVKGVKCHKDCTYCH